MSGTLVAETLGIVGCGRVGFALARLLSPRFRVLVASRQDAERAAALAGGGVRVASSGYLARSARCCVLAVPDRVVPEVAVSMATQGARVILHTCGALGPADLGLPAGSGVSAATFHPLQTFPDAAAAISGLPGSFIGVCGEGPARTWCERLARAIGCTPLPVDERKLPLYHAGAVLASNCLIGLLDAATEALQASGVARETGRAALAPLATASLRNALTMGAEQALTGPVSRGDVGTVGRHLDSVSTVSEPLGDLYRLIGLRLVAIARRGGLDPQAADGLAVVLGEKGALQ